MMDEMKCPNCNNTVKSSWRICPYCKQILSEQQRLDDLSKYSSVVEKKDYPQKSRARIGFLCVILVVVIIALLVIIFFAIKPSVEYGELYDSRDGQTYRTVKIDHQEWMAENLKYKTKNSSCIQEDCEWYGRIYTWKGAMNACPPGWHLPSEYDFITLINNVGGKFSNQFEGERTYTSAGAVLKSKDHLWEGENGKDKYGMDMKPAAYLVGCGTDFDGEPNGGDCYFLWTSTENGSFVVRFGLRGASSDAVLYSDGASKSDRFSVRCLKN